MKIMFIAVVVLMCSVLSACAPKVTVTPIVEQEVYLQYCKSQMPILEKYTIDKDGKKVYDGAEVLRVFDEWALQYTQCAVLHDQLVNLLKNLRTNNVNVKFTDPRDVGPVQPIQVPMIPTK